ncbi:MAG: hypothetical protein JNJ58_10235 [Chitinophagaceae bacterium]|nr:hypothetical protein [Chitinophagaceae bacterium]
MYRLLFLFILLLNGLAVHSSPPLVQWNSRHDSINIADKSIILQDKDNVLTIDQLGDSLFEPSRQHIITYNNDSYYWLKFTLDNPTNDQLLLELAQPIMDKVDFYYEDTLTGGWKVMHAGYHVPLHQKLYRHQYQLFPLLKNRHDYYLRFQSLGLSVPIRIWKENAYDVKITKQRIMFGIFTGLMLFVIMINIFFFFSLRRNAYIHRAVLVFLYYCIAANVEGYILYVFPNADLIYGLNIYAIIALPIGITYVMFFLESKKYTPRLHRLAWIVVAIFASYNLWHLLLSPLELIYITHVMGLTNVLIMLIIAAQIGRRGNKMGYYYFVGYAIFFVIAIIDSISRLTGYPPVFFEISYISIAFLVEGFALSYLLTKRFEWEKEASDLERIQTNELLLVKTMENEKIMKEQNILLEKMVKERTQELTLEKQKSDELLLNILPADVAEELKMNGSAKARRFDSVSVLFVDIKDFTLLSENQDAETVVRELDYCFKAFDQIIKNYNLEKIKTIGDAYMCAGGLPVLNTTHAHDIIKGGLAICAFMQKLKEEKIAKQLPYFEIRIGICSGPVMAGIVGSEKFAYDIWGDTVNTASRMEKHSEPGRVNISGSTYALVMGDFDIEYRGKIEAKNKGLIDMYFVNGVKE